jgi:hypothetical protein
MLAMDACPVILVNNQAIS